MTDGWKCPVCSRGVSPNEKTCDHGGGVGLAPLNPYPNSDWRVYGCAACAISGVCMCVRRTTISICHSIYGQQPYIGAGNL